MKFKHTAAIALFALIAGPVFAAAPCETEIEGNDAMKYNKASIEVPKTCKQFTVKLKHVGKLPKSAMGHNWVLAKTADMQAIAKDGVAAGLPNNYIKAGDARVIAHTKVVGGGESDSIKFDVSKLNAADAYSFFCSFPGHPAMMKGTLTVK